MSLLLRISSSGQDDFSASLLKFLVDLDLGPSSLARRTAEAAQTFGEHVIPFALTLLAVTFAVRLIYTIYREVSSGDLVEMMSSLLGLALMGIILLTIIDHWGDGSILSVPGMVDDLAARLFQAIDLTGAAAGASTAGESMGRVVDLILAQIIGLLGKIYKLITDTMEKMSEIQLISMSRLANAVKGWFSPADEAGLGAMAMLAAYVFLIIVASITSLCVIALGLALLFHAFSGFFAVQIVVAFGPLAVAAYPLVDSWAKRAVSAAVGGVIQMAGAIFIIYLISEIVDFTQISVGV